MKHHIEVVISDSEWVDILTVHSETGSAIGSSVPLENVQELIYKLEKILNVKVLCAVGDFENEIFNLPQTLIRCRNLNKPPQPLLHKTRVISWLWIINEKLKLK